MKNFYIFEILLILGIILGTVYIQMSWGSTSSSFGKDYRSFLSTSSPSLPYPGASVSLSRNNQIAEFTIELDANSSSAVIVAYDKWEELLPHFNRTVKPGFNLSISTTHVAPTSDASVDFDVRISLDNSSGNASGTYRFIEINPGNPPSPPFGFPLHVVFILMGLLITSLIRSRRHKSN